MGYDLHITRAAEWSQNEASLITEREWLAVIASDPELAVDPENGPPDAVWHGSGGSSGEAYFHFFEGNISAKYPDRATLGKMLEIAAKLEAQVQGDDGEVYSHVDQLSDTLSPHDIKVLRRQRFTRIAGPSC
jgi:hypothetical protein